MQISSVQVLNQVSPWHSWLSSWQLNLTRTQLPELYVKLKKKKDLIDQYLVGRNHLSYMSFLMLTTASMTQCIISDCWFGYELQLGAAVWAVMVIVRVEYTAPFWDIFVWGESYRKVLLGLVLFHQAPARGPSRKTEVQSGVCQATIPDCSSNR